MERSVDYLVRRSDWCGMLQDSVRLAVATGIVSILR